ncbi:MAG TPA: NeuD/PglB/VioB family sugar acetyltransferase [Burkholderiales bacterium]|jgi:sugar O-acyltransferase (sialic acid O-acetyltransferase NeuD family)|nr:NeuD/PglB/VioB family sugar acetyltransferase [Burkholderiales bacterium]
MHELIIVGAGGFGREVLSWANAMPEAGKQWTFGGFIEEVPDALKSYPRLATAIIGDDRDYQPKPGQIFAMAIGDPKRKLKVAADLLARGAVFINVIHPHSAVGEGVKLGIGCVLCPGALVSADAVVGNFVSINHNAGVGHDVIVGEGCTISSHADLTGFVKLGRGVMVGSHAVVLPKVEVGDFAVVGAGAVVVRNVAAQTTVYAQPARKL